MNDVQIFCSKDEIEALVKRVRPRVKKEIFLILIKSGAPVEYAEAYAEQYVGRYIEGYVTGYAEGKKRNLDFVSQRWAYNDSGCCRILQYER